MTARRSNHYRTNLKRGSDSATESVFCSESVFLGLSQSFLGGSDSKYLFIFNDIPKNTLTESVFWVKTTLYVYGMVEAGVPLPLYIYTTTTTTIKKD